MILPNEVSSTFGLEIADTYAAFRNLKRVKKDADTSSQGDFDELSILE